MDLIRKNIGWIVAFAVFYLTGYNVISSIVDIYYPVFKPLMSVLRLAILLCLLMYQRYTFSLSIKDKTFVLFFIVYSAYILLYITLWRVYPLETLLAAPTSVSNFMEKSVIIFIYILCAETILKKFSIGKFLILSIILCVLPSIAYISVLGKDALQYYELTNNMTIVGRLVLAYSNAPILVVVLVNANKIFSNRFLNYITVVVVTLIISYILLICTKRGPILWSIVIVFFSVLIRFKLSIMKGVIALSTVLCIIYIFGDVLLDMVSPVAPSTVERIRSTIYEGDTAHRFDTNNMENSGYILGIEQFLKSPIWGDYFRITDNNSIFKGCYPHNLFIEIAMTMGLIGLIPFLLLLKKTYINVLQLLQSQETNKISCVCLFLSVFLQLQTTGSIVLNGFFWFFLYLIFASSKIIVTKRL